MKALFIILFVLDVLWHQVPVKVVVEDTQNFNHFVVWILIQKCWTYDCIYHICPSSQIGDCPSDEPVYMTPLSPTSFFDSKCFYLSQSSVNLSKIDLSPQGYLTSNACRTSTSASASFYSTSGVYHPLLTLSQGGLIVVSSSPLRKASQLLDINDYFIDSHCANSKFLFVFSTSGPA